MFIFREKTCAKEDVKYLSMLTTQFAFRVYRHKHRKNRKGLGMMDTKVQINFICRMFSQKKKKEIYS